MNHENKFAVSRFENRNGVISWRVAGWLHGVRIRRNYRTKEEAAAEKAGLELSAIQATSGLRSAITFLADDQLRETESLFRRLQGYPRSLSFYLDYALANYREPASQHSLADAVTKYLAKKDREVAQQIISAPQATTIRRNLEVLKNQFPGSALVDLSVGRLTAYCERGAVSLKTYNNRRGILSTFLRFALQQDWIATNPVERIPYHRIAYRRGSAPTISSEQAQKLMAYVEGYQGGRLVPFFALCLFAGIRPCLRSGEIRRIRPEQVRLDTGVIHIEPEVSKVRMKRNVSIQPNLAAWLRAYPLDRFPVIFPHLRKYRANVAERFGLSHDIMRHTFISMFVAKFRSMGEAALQAGNSESIIRKHYLDLKSPGEAEEFFNILPQYTTAGASNCGVVLVTGADHARKAQAAA